MVEQVADTRGYCGCKDHFRYLVCATEYGLRYAECTGSEGAIAIFITG
jgi:hypothetical protein